MSSLPTREELAAVFGRTADTYDTVIPLFATLGRRVADLAELQAGDRVLDVACGRGASLLPAAAQVGPGGEVVGIDIAPEMVALVGADLKRLGVANASARTMDAENLDFGDASFDVVLCGFALFLMPDPVRAARECLRVLTSGGRVVVSMPTGAGPTWDFFGQLVGRFAPRATRPVPPTPLPRANLDEVLHEAGFADIAVTDEVAHFVFPEPETWWRWAWSTGFRAPLECFAPDVLEEFAAEAFAHLRSVAQDDGIHLDQQARFVTARRPD